MQEICQSGSEGGGADIRSPYPYIVAQGKDAEAAALGNRHPTPDLSFFQSSLARSPGAPNWIGKKRGDHFLSLTQGGARSSLALGYYLIVLTGLQFGSLRSQCCRTRK